MHCMKKHCSGAVSIWQNKSDVNLYYELLCANADRRWGLWGVRDVDVSRASGDSFFWWFQLCFRKYWEGCFHMQTCLNWDLKLFSVIVTKVKLFNHHSSERDPTATTWNSLKLDVIIIHLTKRENMRIVPSLNIYPQGNSLVIYCIYFPSHPHCLDE